MKGLLYLLVILLVGCSPDSMMTVREKEVFHSEARFSVLEKFKVFDDDIHLNGRIIMDNTTNTKYMLLHIGVHGAVMVEIGEEK